MSQKTKSKEKGATVEKQILAIWYVVIARTAQYNPYYLPEDQIVYVEIVLSELPCKTWKKEQKRKILLISFFYNVYSSRTDQILLFSPLPTAAGA